MGGHYCGNAWSCSLWVVTTAAFCAVLSGDGPVCAMGCELRRRSAPQSRLAPNPWEVCARTDLVSGVTHLLMTAQGGVAIIISILLLLMYYYYTPYRTYLQTRQAQCKETETTVKLRPKVPL